MPEILIYIANAAIHTAAVVLLYSTILLLPGLLLSYAVKPYGAVLQSAVLRVTLVFSLLLPALTMLWPYERPSVVTIEKIPVIKSEHGSIHSGAHYPDATIAPSSKSPSGGDLRYENTVVLPERTAVPLQPEVSGKAAIPLQNSEISYLVRGIQPVRRVMYILFALLWAAASGLFLVRYFGASLYLHMLLKRSVPAKKEFILRCAGAAEQLGCRTPRVVQNASIRSPLAAGLFRPAVFMPLGELEHEVDSGDVFLHELTHLKRHDYLWNQLRYFATALFPFQPLLWLLSSRLAITSDYVCDETVVEKSPDRKQYAMTLFTLSYALPDSLLYHGVGDGFLSCRSSIRRRIERIVGYRRDAKRPSAGMSYGLGMLAAAILAVSGSLVGIESSMGGVSIIRAATQAPSDARLALAQAFTFPRGNREISVGNEAGRHGMHVTARAETGLAADMPERSSSGGTATAGYAFNSGDSAVSPVSATVSAGIGMKSPQSVQEDYAGPADSSAGTGAVTVSRQSALPLARLGDPAASDADSVKDDEGNTILALLVAGGEHNFPTVVDNGIKLPKPMALNVSVEFDYENYDYDFENVEDKHKYATYYGLAKWKNEPAWSPDGRWIAFTDQSRIWIVSADGGRPKMVYENFYGDYPVGNIESLCFTPDSREVTFKKDVYDTERGSTIEISSGRAIFSNPIPNIESVDIETGAHRIVVENGHTCAWSPDGRYLCYLYYYDGSNPDNREKNGIPVLLDVRSGESEFLDVDASLRYGKPAFSPGGTQLVLPVRDGVEAIEFYSYDIAYGGMTRLTRYDERDGFGKYRNFPEFSPDGAWIMYTDFTWTKDNPGKRLFALNTGSGDIFQLFRDEDSPHSYGKWSPDGAKICYLVEQQDANYIYMCDFNPESFGAPISTGVSAFGPLAFSLRPNFPNPFNLATTIEFTLPEESAVRLDIFNSSGQRVRTLADDVMRPGSHSLAWDGLDDSGNTVSSGTYLSRLRAGKHSATIKMMLMK